MKQVKEQYKKWKSTIKKKEKLTDFQMYANKNDCPKIPN